jgi:hypothetical protein
MICAGNNNQAKTISFVHIIIPFFHTYSTQTHHKRDGIDKELIL